MTRFNVTCRATRRIAGPHFEHHVPDRVESTPPAPGKLPNAPLGGALLDNPPEEVEFDDVDPTLRQDQPPILCSAPRSRSIPVSGVLVLTRKGMRWQFPQTLGARFLGSWSPSMWNSRNPVSPARKPRRCRLASEPGGKALPASTAPCRPVLAREFAQFPLVIDLLVADEVHGGGETAVDEVPRAALRVIELAVGRNGLVPAGAVDAAVRVARNAVPVIRCRVAQSACRHRREA